MITFSVEKITPEIAREYLRSNVSNYRKLSKSKAKLYAEDMRSGKWELNGQPIVFAKDGTLKDGQHRLAGIIYSGIAVQIPVVRGVENDVNIYDVGMRRSNSQIAKSIGIDLPPQAISAAKLVVNRFNSTANGTVIDYVQRNQQELLRAYRVSCLGSGTTSKKSSIVAATYLLLRSELIYAYEAEVFFKVFNSGDTSGTDGYDPSPALVARKMFNERFQKQLSTMSVKEQLEILVLALEDFHNGKHRTENYKIGQPFRFDELITTVRSLD